MQADIRRLPDDRSISGKARRDQVLHHLALAVDVMVLPVSPVRSMRKRPPSSPSSTLVDQPLPVQPIGDARLLQQLDGAVLQNAGRIRAST